ncbi:MAG: NHL repeat-containing protein [Thaumarchaeota archaeon]|nr:NHL repeat-containing protein [Nitrososphaerota archaeon]
MLRYVLLALLLVPAQSFAFTSGQNATLVIGHTHFSSGGTIHGNPSPNTLYIPEGIAFDHEGNLWVVDTGFNRILEFHQPFKNGEAASMVIGQGNFTSTGPSLSPTGLDQPYGMVFDNSGNMWVADTNNNRIVEYKEPFSTGEAASIVMGSPSFDKGTYTTTAGSLAAPYGLAFDKSGNLWAVDYYDNRILEYVPPFSNLMNASIVIGQTDFTSNSDGSTRDRTNLPSAIAFDRAGNMWVTDSLNNRVLEFKKPFSTDESSSLVIGQKDFEGSYAGISNDSLNTPYGITFDGLGDLWVTDGNNARVLEYKPPFADGMAASVVLGQADFEGMHTGTSSNMLSEPYDVKVDGAGNLWVADTDNNRVLEYATTAVPEFGPMTVAALAASIAVLVAIASRMRPVFF